MYFCSSVNQVRPPGHHAGVRQAMGFCLHNNAAVAALAAQAAGARKVLILDWVMLPLVPLWNYLFFLKRFEWDLIVIKLRVDWASWLLIYCRMFIMETGPKKSLNITNQWAV